MATTTTATRKMTGVCPRCGFRNGDVSVEEAAAMLGLSDTAIRNWIAQDRQKLADAAEEGRTVRKQDLKLPGVERRNDRGHKTWWIPLASVRAAKNGR